MNRRNENPRRLVVCNVCKNDRGHLLRGEDGTLYIECTSCGHEMLTVQREPAAVP